MRKLLSIVLALALALSLSVTAFAADTSITETSDPKTGSTDVTYTVDPAYTVTIPASVTIDGADGSNTVTVSASGVKIATGEQVVVELSGINVTTDNPTGNTDFTVALTDNTSEKLAYTVKDASGNTIEKGNAVLTVASGLNNDTKSTGASTGSATLTFALATDAVVKYAGEYTGTVTFTVSVASVDTSSD